LVCDDHKRIRYINLGWPGSVNDQRVFQNSALHKNFGGQVALAFGQVFFNDLLSSCHVKVEHTIGIWKGRFHSSKISEFVLLQTGMGGFSSNWGEHQQLFITYLQSNTLYQSHSCLWMT
jgi:hypothetical protein